MATDLQRLSKSKYMLLTTFRRDGTPVPTPVWVTDGGDELIVWTSVKAGKVKRVRNNGTVELAECDVRGNQRGETAKGLARVLESSETPRVRGLLRAKYGLLGRLVVGSSALFRGKDASLGIAIKVE